MLNGISQRSKKGLKRDKPEQSGTVTEPERTEPARGRGHSENIKSKAWHRAGEVSIRKLPSEALRGVQVMAEAYLIAYECPKCGKRTKALPRADIWCPCGRKMKQKKAGASKGDRP